jgi:hypothetical protein
MAAGAGLGFWKVFYYILGGAPSGLLALRIASRCHVVLAAELVALLVGAFRALVPLDAGPSLRFVERRKRMIGGRIAMITDGHSLVVPDSG